MVILIGGVGDSGKTLLAHHLMVQHGITYLSIDHIKMGLYRGDAACGFTPEDDSFALGERLWPIVKGIIMTNIENRQNIIIEGCYLLPHLVGDFEEPYRAHILTIFIGFSEDYIRKNCATQIALHMSAIEDKTECNDLPTMLKDHHEMRTQCLENNSNYFEINRDYETEMVKVFDFVEKQIGAKGQALKDVATYR